MLSARLLACRLLERAERGAYSNIALEAELSKSGLDSRDKALAARIFYGTVERKLTLEHLLRAHLSRPLEKLDSPVRNALMTGAYQLLYMDGVPDSAAVNEAVNLVREMKKSSAAGLVNACLRGIIRDGKEIPPVKGDKYDKLSVEYSCPGELIKRISEGYGEDRCMSLLKYSFGENEDFLRVNTLRVSPAELVKSLNVRGIEAEVSEYDENAVVCKGLREIEGDTDYKNGNYHVQDLSSQLCCRAVAPKAGETVIDLCAAPGGKSFTMAEIMGNRGRVISCELHEKRRRLIKSGAERLGLSCIEAVTLDGGEENSGLPKADRVLCDVPCSGYGVMGRKPEIKYKPLGEADRLPQVQLRILKGGARHVKKGGVLVYSTCTVNRAENEGVVERFLEENPDFKGEEFPEEMGEKFKGVYCKVVFPDDFGSDGFFICRMRRGE
ncbi:MAG: 16S rRNA (cytosine(967)-C(5))-methyltransferase RsmB [Ruminococcus sp.]|nr:16S rRNA (cytosine(967)-C(5))-methyltransferase RsmB [Ruminococcus sp.]